MLTVLADHSKRASALNEAALNRTSKTRLQHPPALTVARPDGPRSWNCSCTCSRPSASLYSLPCRDAQGWLQRALQITGWVSSDRRASSQGSTSK